MLKLVILTFMLSLTHCFSITVNIDGSQRVGLELWQ